MALAAGTTAPDFERPTDDDTTVRLQDFRGSWLVLYFYPKDDTSACTAEACDFRDAMESLATHGVRIVGVSPDTVRKHKNFRAKYELNFTLVADTDHAVCEAYDVWKQKSMYGRSYMGVERTTYVIDPQGTIHHTFEKVSVKGHVDAVREVLAAAGATG